MGRTNFYNPQKKEAPWKIHPIWSGIGCAMFFILPAISFFAAELILIENQTQKWFPIPVELRGPSFQPGLFAQLAVAAVVLLFLFAILMAVYMLVYRMVGPSRYGPTDAPPPKKRQSTRRR